MPRSGVLLALTSALNVTEEHLLSEDHLVLQSVEFRKKPSTSVREEAAIEAKWIHLLERYLAIEDLLRLKNVDWEKPRSAPYPVLEIRDAKQAARSVREDWGLGNDPIPQLAALLEERGVKVLSLALENIDGLAARVRRKDQMAACVVVVNGGAWAERKRFTLAHELGHMVIDPAPSMSDEEIEKAAYRFAGVFLMPADTFRAEMGSNRSSVFLGELAALKERFGVSYQAIAYRCKDLRILKRSTFVRLFKLFNNQGWRKPRYEELAALKPELEEPKRFEHLCYRALAENLIGESRVAKLLGITVRELGVRLDDPAR